MSIIANNNNYSHSSSAAFHSSSHESSSSGQLDRYDLEVEEILNDIGFFANDDHDYVDPLNNLAGEPEPGFPMSYIFPPTLMAPVSPDHPPSHTLNPYHESQNYYHNNNNNNNQNHYHNNVIMGMSSGNYNPTVTPSGSVQDIQTFSVPNPMAMSSSMDHGPSMSSSSSTPMMMPAIQERDIVNNNNKKATVTKAPKNKAPSTKKEPSSKGRKRKLMDPPTAPEAAAVLSSMPASAALAAAQEAFANHAAAAAGRSSHQNPNRDDGLTEEDLEERRQRNREHAKRSRQRKKSLTSTLEESVEDLKAENAKLREQIYAMIGPQKAQAMLEARQETSRTQFVQGLMQPANRILDEKTLTFLKSLRKNVTLDDDDSSSNNDNNTKN